MSHTQYTPLVSDMVPQVETEQPVYPVGHLVSQPNPHIDDVFRNGFLLDEIKSEPVAQTIDNQIVLPRNEGLVLTANENSRLFETQGHVSERDNHDASYGTLCWTLYVCTIIRKRNYI